MTKGQDSLQAIPEGVSENTDNPGNHLELLETIFADGMKRFLKVDYFAAIPAYINFLGIHHTHVKLKLAGSEIHSHFGI